MYLEYLVKLYSVDMEIQCANGFLITQTLQASIRISPTMQAQFFEETSKQVQDRLERYIEANNASFNP